MFLSSKSMSFHVLSSEPGCLSMAQKVIQSTNPTWIWIWVDPNSLSETKAGLVGVIFICLSSLNQSEVEALTKSSKSCHGSPWRTQWFATSGMSMCFWMVHGHPHGQTRGFRSSSAQWLPHAQGLKQADRVGLIRRLTG